MTKTTFTQAGNRVFLSDNANSKPLTTLPVGVYTVKYDDMRDIYFLETAESFSLPKKLYGKVPQHAERFVQTFADRPNGTGVLLVGEKGSGKTLLSKMLSIEAAKTLAAPTIIVNSPYSGSTFFSFIQSITQPAVILFDEFEKVYGKKEHQEALLTLLDGAYPSKKMFIFTVNDKYALNDNLINRPGRIYYNVAYTGMEPSAIKEYCDDQLNDKTKVQKVLDTLPMFDKINFDMVQAIVEEINRYPNDPVTSIFSLLNVKPSFDDSYSVRCTYSVKKDGVPVKLHSNSSARSIYPFRTDDEEDVGMVMLEDETRFYVYTGQCVHMDIKAKEYHYRVQQGGHVYDVIFTGVAASPFSPSEYILKQLMV